MGPAAEIPPARIEKKSPAPKLTAPVPIFRDIAAQAGLTASHISSREKYYVIESMSGGVGLFDCGNDGKLDVVLVNGSTVDRYRQQGGDLLVTLWHQNANLKFTNITEKAGLTRKGWGMGVAVADFDNDGNLDLFVTGYGGNALYRNKGNCTFEDVTDKAGVRGGGSYLSQNDLRLHFGLGSATTIDTVEVRWPTGKTESFKDVAADKIYTITEGQGIKGTVALPAPESLAF